jgi:hypothetical protein
MASTDEPVKAGAERHPKGLALIGVLIDTLIGAERGNDFTPCSATKLALLFGVLMALMRPEVFLMGAPLGADGMGAMRHGKEQRSATCGALTTWAGRGFTLSRASGH